MLFREDIDFDTVALQMYFDDKGNEKTSEFGAQSEKIVKADSISVFSIDG